MSNEKIDETTVTLSSHAEKTARFSWVTIGMLCSVFSIAVLIVIGSYSGWYLLKMNQQLVSMVTESQNQLQQLQSDFNVLKTATSATQQTAQQFTDDMTHLKKSVNDLSQAKQGNQEKWLLSEARYYVRLAQENLQFSRSVPSAITLLQMADQMVSQIVSPNTATLRKVIAEDITHLQTTPVVDVTSVYAKFIALNNQLDQLPLLKQISSQEPSSASTTKPNQTTWQNAWHAIWQALQRIVIVRYHANGSMPLLVPEQQALLYQNLHTVLAQATWALLYKQSDIYQSSLQQLITLIERYFVLEAPTTQAVLDQLMQLQKINVHPPALTISNTLQAINGV